MKSVPKNLIGVLIVIPFLIFGKFVQALQRTLEFEEELEEKFGGGSRSRETGNDIEDIDRGEKNNRTVSDIRKKYEKKLAAHQGTGSEVCISYCLAQSKYLCPIFALKVVIQTLNNAFN